MTEHDEPYDVFLSHSSNDARVVARLHRVLESYKPPRRSGVPRADRLKVYHYLYDQELDETLRGSLQNRIMECPHFVLVASDSTACAPIVDFEVESFVAARAPSSVRIALVSGRIPDVLPQVIRDALKDVIYVDLRNGNCSWIRWVIFERFRFRRKLIPLLAKLLGIRPDDLVRRERQRTRHRLLTQLVLIILLLSGGWGWTRSDHYQIKEIVESAPSSVGGKTANNWVRALAKNEFYNEALSSIPEIPGRRVQLTAWLDIARSLNNAGKAQKADSAWQQALRIAVQFEGTGNKTGALKRLVEDLVAAERFQEAVSAATNYPFPNTEVEALLEVAKKMAMTGRREESQRVLEKAQRQAIDYLNDAQNPVRLLNSVADAMFSVQLTNTARSVLMKARHRASEITGLSKRSSRLTGLATTFATAGLRDDAREFFVEARHVDRQIADPGSRNTSLRFLAVAMDKAEFPEEADITFNDARVAASAVSSSGERAVYLLSTAKKAAEARRIKQARKIVADISVPGERAEALAILAGVLVKEGRKSEGVSLFNEAISVAGEQARVLFDVAREATKVGHFAQAQKAAEAIPHSDRRIRNNVLNHIALAAAKAQRFEDAQRAAFAISNPEDRVTTLSEAAREIVLHDKAQATWFTEQATRIANEITNASSRTEAFLEITRTHVSASEFDQVREAVQEISYAMYRTRVLIEAVEKAASEGLRDEAISFVELSLNALQELADYEKPEHLLKLAKAAAGAGLFAEVGDIIDALPAGKKRAEATIEMAKIFATNNSPLAEVAVEKLNKLAEPLDFEDGSKIRADAAAVLAKLGQYRKARLMCNPEKCTPRDRLVAYSEILIEYSGRDIPEQP